MSKKCLSLDYMKVKTGVKAGQSLPAPPITCYGIPLYGILPVAY